MIHPDLAPRRRSRRIVWLILAVVILAGAWTAFWFYAAAKAGRIHSCGSQSIGGYPFRIELRCADAGLELRSAQPALTIRLANVIAAVQVYDPTLVIAEMTGPLTIAEAGAQPSYTATWRLAQASVRGAPRALERVSLVLDDVKLDRSAQPVAGARHAELHARASAPAGPPEGPALDLVVKLAAATAPAAGNLAEQPFDADVIAILRGLKDLTPRPLPIVLRDIQAAGGRLEVQNARVQQGETLARATGSLALTERAKLDGTLMLTVAAFERFIAAHGGLQKVFPRAPERAAPALNALDRFAPMLGNIGRERAEASILNLIGQPTQLEGKPATTMALRFADGAAFLGPIPLGQTPAFY